MKYKVNKKKKHQKHKKKDVDLAYDFSKRAYKEFGSFLKTIAIFGSSATKKNSDSNDIDMLLIVDDVSIVLSNEIIETYRVILKKLVSKVSKKLHITTLRFSTFWDLVRNGDPVVVNILRDGSPIIDSGVFEPVQKLLLSGKIRPSAESIWTYFSRAPSAIHNSKSNLLQAAVNLYWAVIDSAHAALMNEGEVPPSPDHIADLLQVRLVNEGKVEQRYAAIMRDFYKLYKDIAHRNIKEVRGEDYDKYQKMADDFVRRMRKIIEEKK
ncbi:MAG: hypothetical protein ACQEP1_06305 [Nanobdellota archaeon]